MATTSTDRMRKHRARRRTAGMKKIEIWVPDVNAPGFAAEAHRQSLAMANSPTAEEDQAFLEDIMAWPSDDE